PHHPRTTLLPYTTLFRSTAVREMIRQYSKRSNETPLHSLDRVATSNTAQQVVARYWARMAYVDIGHATAQQIFLQQRSSINYARSEEHTSELQSRGHLVC